MKEYMTFEVADIVELLDDFFLLFLNKFEDVVVLILKSLVLGLGSSFEIEKKVAQQTINFDLDSRVFKSFLQVFCKLFGCTVVFSLDGGQPETLSFNPLQAKARIGKDVVINLAATSGKFLTLNYDEQFFASRRIGIDVVSLNVDRGNASTENLAQITPPTRPLASDSDGNARTDEGIRKLSDDNFMKAEDYYSNHNIINPYSLYNSEIELKKTSLIDHQEDLNEKTCPADNKYAFNGPVRLEDFYSGSIERDLIREQTIPTKISEFNSNPQPGLHIKEPSFQDLDQPNHRQAVKSQKFDYVRSPDVEPVLMPIIQKDHQLVSKQVDSSDEEDLTERKKPGSEEPSILYKYNLEQSIDFIHGTNYFESVDSVIRDSGPLVIPKTIGNQIKANLQPRDSVLLSTFNEKVPHNQNSEKKPSLGDHIKLLLSQDYESKAVTNRFHDHSEIELHERPKLQPPTADLETQKEPQKEIKETYSSQEEMVIPIRATVIEPQAIQPNVPANQTPHPTPPVPISNPLMMKFGDYSAQISQNSSNSTSVQKQFLKPLVPIQEDSLSKKRPTANVELMNQINQVLLAKLMNDSGQKKSSPSKNERNLDFTPLEEKKEGEDTLGNRRNSETDPKEADMVTRKTRFLTQTDTDKACRLCSKVFKMVKLYYFDGSFFCETCYNTACQKLKKKGINSCPGCTKESSKVLVIKFFLPNKFTNAQGSLLFTREKKVEPFYGFLHRYSLMISKSSQLEKALLLVANNIVTPLNTWAEVKSCKNCAEDFIRCVKCKDLIYKDELFKGESCGHPYCLDCLTLIFLKKYADKKEFTCKASFCWKKSSLDKALNFIVKSLEEVQSEINQSGVKVK